jgi:integrase
MSPRTPSYRHHKPTGQAVVTLSGQDLYLGKHGSTASRIEYDRLVAEWLSNGRNPIATGDLTVVELVAAYLRFADGYYRRDGVPTGEAENLKDAVRPLLKLYGHTPAADFGPLALKAVRDAMIEADICRTEVNRRVGRLVRAFKWAESQELVPAGKHHTLATVSGLRRGRSEARESTPVGPVPEAHVDAVLPHVSRQVRAMIELQRLTGMRPGEVTAMRTGDLDRTGPVWTYVPARHKTQHHNHSRTIFLGPQAQAVLAGWLRADPGAYLFSPAEAMEERWAEQRRDRKTPVQPSQASRKRPTPGRRPGGRYEPGSYRQAIVNACKRAGVPGWHPHQLRHNAATRLRREFGLEVALVVLGHARADTTQIYAERDLARAREVMAEVG